MAQDAKSDETPSVQIPKEFLCPITTELMADPHITLSGHTYEKYAIEQWLSNHRRDPMTNEVLKSKLLIPNHSLRKQIQCFIEEHGLKLRSTKSSPFKYLLQILRLHAQHLKGMHTASNTLRKYLYLFIGDDLVPKHYEVVFRRFIKEWSVYSAEIQGKWVDIMASIIYIKDKIYQFHQSNLDETDSDFQSDANCKLDPLSMDQLFAFHIVKSLISIKTSLREIVAWSLKLKFLLNFVFDHVSLTAFSKKSKKRPHRLQSPRSVAPSASSPAVDEEKEIESGRNAEDESDEIEEEEEDGGGSSGWLSSDFEDDLTAFGMIAGVLIAANAGGSTGAAVGSAGGPVGTMFGAAIGFYVGAIAGSAPSMLYGLYLEEHKLKRQEMDSMWKGIYCGWKRYQLWIDRERKQFQVCDRILVQCMQSITHCVDNRGNEKGQIGHSVDEEQDDIDWIYQSVDEELVEIWQYDISRITPFLQQCLSRAE